jgi:epoxyqueuosine reductase QueG
LPVPASQILDWDRLLGHLSHRAMAERAGLGWRGRNNLLVNPRFGSMVRYATVLTDMPIPDRGGGEEPLGCGACSACIGACPVGAIHDTPERFELDRCAAQLRRFSREEKLNTMICGLCVRVCPGKPSGGQ